MPRQSGFGRHAFFQRILVFRSLSMESADQFVLFIWKTIKSTARNKPSWGLPESVLRKTYQTGAGRWTNCPCRKSGAKGLAKWVAILTCFIRQASVVWVWVICNREDHLHSLEKRRLEAHVFTYRNIYIYFSFRNVGHISKVIFVFSTH